MKAYILSIFIILSLSYGLSYANTTPIDDSIRPLIDQLTQSHDIQLRTSELGKRWFSTSAPINLSHSEALAIAHYLTDIKVDTYSESDFRNIAWFCLYEGALKRLKDTITPEDTALASLVYTEAFFKNAARINYYSGLVESEEFLLLFPADRLDVRNNKDLMRDFYSVTTYLGASSTLRQNPDFMHDIVRMYPRYYAQLDDELLSYPDILSTMEEALLSKPNNYALKEAYEIGTYRRNPTPNPTFNTQIFDTHLILNSPFRRHKDSLKILTLLGFSPNITLHMEHLSIPDFPVTLPDASHKNNTPFSINVPTNDYGINALTFTLDSTFVDTRSTYYAGHITIHYTDDSGQSAEYHSTLQFWYGD